MAMRENTGLQVALILFVMITVVLAVTTYLYFDASKKAEVSEEKAVDKADNLEASVVKLNAEVKELRGMMGYDTSIALADISSGYQADMAKFGEGYGFDKKRDYRLLPDHLHGRIVALNKELDKSKDDITTLAADLEKARNQEVAIVAARDDKFVKAVENYDDEKKKIGDQYNEQLVRVNRIQGDFDTVSSNYTSKLAVSDKKVDELSERNTKLEMLRKNLNDKIENMQNPTKVGVAEKPDGRVTWVSQRGGMVYINLGSDDGLQRSTMFTVYDAGAVNLAATDPKASIEVTTIRGPHLAEARIIEDTLSNPILSQDNVYSPVWDPGQKSHFALVGFMDVDNDRKSDRRLVRSLIAQNGGAVDAEVLDDGSREGKLTINTRYLVVGERPTEKTKGDALAAYSQMIDEASDLGIETISVERLLSDMGWRGNERTVGSGTDPSGGTFKAVPKEPTGTGNGGFQQRTRPGGSTRRESAY